MKTDISSRADIDLLMERFYSRAMSDPVIGHFFTEVVHLDLAHHLPVIGDFWESVLFGAGNYARHGRHPLLIHAEMHKKKALEEHHFRRWLEIFTQTVDEAFAGTRAEFTKQRGFAIANRMLSFVSGNG